MRQMILLLPLLAALMTACHSGEATEGTSAQVDTVNLVMRISQQSRLYTAEYNIHKIVTHDDLLQVKGNFLGIKYNKSLPIGDRKIAIPIDVTMKAYIDFTTFGNKNIEQRGDYLHIILPDARVVVTSSRVDYAHMQQFTSIFRHNYSDAEKSEITRQGTESIIAQIPEIGITETARKSAAQMLIPMLTELGYKEDHIVITFRDDWEQTRLEDIYDNEASNFKISKQ